MASIENPSYKISKLKSSRDVYKLSFNDSNCVLIFWYDGYDLDTVRIKEEYCVLKGVKHGYYKSYYKNGRCKKLCKYNEGRIEGKCFEWDINHNFCVEDNYVNGVSTNVRII